MNRLSALSAVIAGGLLAGQATAQSTDAAARSADNTEEDAYAAHFWTAEHPLMLNRATLRGTVTQADAPTREFAIDTGAQRITIEADSLAYNPLDELGYQQLETGDRVSVSGDFGYNFLDGHVLEADSVITLSDANQS